MAFQVLLFAAFISLSVADSVPHEVPGTLVDRSIIISHHPPSCNPSDVYTTCSGCNTVFVCLGAISDHKNCATTSPDTPFCVKGACSASADNSVGCFPPSLSCTGVGIYPDPNTCQTYHYCEGIGQESSLYQCPPDYVFNPTSGMCKQEISSSLCLTVKCDPSKIFSTYGTNSQYYAYCQYNGNVVTNIVMLKCEPYTQFDGTNCVFTCPSEGHFQHADETQYYQCYYSAGHIVYQVQNCSPGKIFNQLLQVCVSK